MIVAVAGGKGGVGKSTTALNLGRELDAVVVDADVSIPDLPSGSGINLHDVLAGRADPAEAIDDDGPVAIVPSGRTLAGACASTLDRVGPALERLERRRGRVVVDCPAGLARDVGVSLRSVDLAVLVTAPEKAAVVDAARTAELAAALRTPVGSVVLNEADPARHGELADRIGRLFDADVTLVERSSAVADAQARWLPVRDHAPDAPAVEAYNRLAARLLRSADRQGSRP